MFEINKIYQGNSLEILKTFPDESIDMVMTSPPYWALRDYGNENQLGLEPTFQEYITKLCNIFDEVKRVLKKEGTCWVNMGDTYYGSGKGVGGDISKSKQTYVLPNDWKRPSRESFNNIKVKKNCILCGKEFEGSSNSQFCSKECLNKKGNSFRSQNRLLQDKTLCMIPERFAIEMINRGWILRNQIIWHKPNAMPSSVKDRFTVDFEKIFFFSKNKHYYFETQREPHKEESIKRACRARENVKSKEYSIAYKEENVGYENMNEKFEKGELRSVHKDGRNMRTTWSISLNPFHEAHFATYPEELCVTPILAGCPKNGIVLDPFLGSGTTAKVATDNQRNWVGIELNEKYIEIAKERIPKSIQVMLKSYGL